MVISSGRRYNDDEDWLVVEILTRLQLKPLIRFKSVCRRWCSLIQKDQNFIDLHLKTRPHIFIVVPLPRTEEQEEWLMRVQGGTYLDPWPYKEFHITADLLFEEKEQVYNINNGGSRPTRCGTKVKLVVDTITEKDSSSYNIITKPLNGLICLIDSHREYATRVCNISTGEMSPWFPSSLVLGKERLVKHFPSFKLDHVVLTRKYEIGFDPAINEHKLVCVWGMESNGSIYYICEVLTIGLQGNNSNRWRRIEEVPPYYLNDSVHVNGVIYWTNYSLDCWASNLGYHPVCLVAFDVGSEKFRTITIPDFILGNPRGVFTTTDHILRRIFKLFEVDGNLAMVVKLDNFTFKMYIYKDHVYKDKEEGINNGTSSNSSSSSFSPCKKNERWSEVNSITLPFYMGKYHCVCFHTFVGSRDKILVTLSVRSVRSSKKKKKSSKKKEKSFSIYCYNWKKGSWAEVDVSGIPSSIPQLCFSSFSTTFFESLLPLNDQSAP